MTKREWVQISKRTKVKRFNPYNYLVETPRRIQTGLLQSRPIKSDRFFASLSDACDSCPLWTCKVLDVTLSPNLNNLRTSSPWPMFFCDNNYTKKSSTVKGKHYKLMTIVNTRRFVEAEISIWSYMRCFTSSFYLH